MGNLRSVQKALSHVGDDAQISADPTAAREATRLVLPGVGSFGDGMQRLNDTGLGAAVRDFAATGRPLLGICLGMQLLMTSSTEHTTRDQTSVPGLDLIGGHVTRFTEDQGRDENGQPRPHRKVPHMGWNAIAPRDDRALFADTARRAPDQRYVYFVHGYFCTPDDETDVAATCTYGVGPAPTFCAAVQRDNVMATQFHPEKSQEVGLEMLRAFVALT